MRELTLSERFSLARQLATSRRSMKRMPYLSPDEMRAVQFRQIQTLVRHAYETVPLYRELYQSKGFEPADLRSWSDFEALPVISKQQLIDSYPERALSSVHKGNDLLVSRSSGSTGAVLDIAYEGRTMIQYALATIRLYEMGFNYRPWHRHLYIYTSPYPLTSILGLYPLTFVSTLTPIEEIWEKILKVRPHLLVCYPSHLRQITDFASARERAVFRPRLISVSSEMSSEAEREHLSSVYECPALDNYSSEELARIASQCRHKTYHVFEDMNYLETLDPSNRPTSELGTVVGTNLHNVAMPLIRYVQNDLARIRAEECACGWRFRTMTDLQGRANDQFVLPSGKTLTSGFLLDATYEFLLEYRSAIRDFCLIQDQRDKIRLQLVRGADWQSAIAEQIAERFETFLEPGVDFSISLVEECEKTVRGKRNPIISYAVR